MKKDTDTRLFLPENTSPYGYCVCKYMYVECRYANIHEEEIQILGSFCQKTKVHMVIVCVNTYT